MKIDTHEFKIPCYVTLELLEAYFYIDTCLLVQVGYYLVYPLQFQNKDLHKFFH